MFTHLPSNVLLAAIACAPTLPIAVALLLARSLLSQMDVPTRQAYVVAVVDPSERTAAAAYTNTARYVTRPVGALLAGAVLRGSLGAPFVIAGTLKSAYDLGMYAIFRRVSVPPLPSLIPHHTTPPTPPFPPPPGRSVRASSRLQEPR